jgi:hypothetical protein
MSLPDGVRATPVAQGSVLKWMEEHAIYDSERGAEVRFFGVFEAPDVSTAGDGATLIIVDDVNVRLDTLAYRYWGDATLGWIIALYNDLDCPDAELYRGQQLTIPGKQWVSDHILLQQRAARRNAI